MCCPFVMIYILLPVHRQRYTYTKLSQCGIMSWGVMLVKEVWKEIDGYNGRYLISNYGRIKNRDGWIMKQKPSKDGYVRILLFNGKKYKAEYTHILVAKAFLPKPTSKSEVNHIDADKSNNLLWNLEWVTRSENHYHAVSLGLKPENPTKGKRYEDNPCVKPVYQYDMQGNFMKKWNSRREAADFYGCQPNSISRAMNGERKSCAGFIWRHLLIE